MFGFNITQEKTICNRKKEYLFEKMMQNFRKNISYIIHVW